MNHQIVNPGVPYIGPVSRADFTPGKGIIIKGCPPGTANRFNINFQCGPPTASEYAIALQIAVAVHLLGGHITLNSFENGIWGEEQHGTLPIKRSKKFEIVITSDFLQYKITIDGQHYAEFPHRIHNDRVTHLAINGNVEIFEISYGALSRFEIGGISGNRMDEVSRPSAPMGNDGDDPPPFSGSPAPPSYEFAIESSKKAPYPTSDPMGMPCIPNNRGTDFLAFPSAASRTDYGPARTIGIYAPPAQPTVRSSPARDALVPLNMHESYTGPVVQSRNEKCSPAMCAFIVIILIICGVIVIVKLNNAGRL